MSNLLWERKERDGVLIAAHRGTCGANIVQNTWLSCENALQHGADVVEMDAALSRDGIFYAIHDGEELSLWGMKRDVRTLLSREIERFPVMNGLDLFIDQHLERLEYVLERLRGKCLINIDRSWFYWKEMIQFLDKMQMQDQIVLKAPAVEEYLKELEEAKVPILFMPIIRTVEEWELVKKYDIHTVAVEIIFEDVNAPVVQPEFIKELHDRKVLAWVNSLTLNDDITLSALLDDNRAIINGYDTAWGKLIDMGFDVIQTDWPALVKKYLEQRTAR